MFRDIASVYGEELLLPRPIPKLDDHPFSAVRDCLFNIFAATLRIIIIIIIIIFWFHRQRTSSQFVTN